MEKIKLLISKNKGLSVVVILALILFLIMFIILLGLIFGGSSNKYGDRLDGIKDVEITKKEYSSLEKLVKKSELVSDFEHRLQGKIVYMTITFTSSATVDQAKELATSTLSVFDKDEIAFYDFEFILTQDKDTEKPFVITGTKHPNVDTIGWVKS